MRTSHFLSPQENGEGNVEHEEGDDGDREEEAWRRGSEKSPPCPLLHSPTPLGLG